MAKTLPWLSLMADGNRRWVKYCRLQRKAKVLEQHSVDDNKVCLLYFILKLCSTKIISWFRRAWQLPYFRYNGAQLSMHEQYCKVFISVDVTCCSLAMNCAQDFQAEVKLSNDFIFQIQPCWVRKKRWKRLEIHFKNSMSAGSLGHATNSRLILLSMT